MELRELDRLLNLIPAVVRGLHPVSLAYLHEPVHVYSTLEELVCVLDDLKPSTPERVLSWDTDPRYSVRFPVVDVQHDPFTPELNRVLFDRYDQIAGYMLTHAQVADRIVTMGRKMQTVILVLLDGLSYSDCQDWQGVEPCLASAPTITQVGFPAVIGSPPLATRLFSEGFSRRIGFTYWSRQDNELTNQLFYAISKVEKLSPSSLGVFDEVVDWLSANDTAKTYVQVVCSALDDYAEGHRQGIPRTAVCGQIRRGLEAMFDVLVHKGLPASLFAVSDHGILWKDTMQEIERIDFSGARYNRGRSGPGRGRYFHVGGQHYWVLDYPQMGRDWRSNEQGIHGGISFQESIVPFIHWETGDLC